MKANSTIRFFCVLFSTLMMMIPDAFTQTVPYVSYQIGHPTTADTLNNQGRSTTDLAIASNFYAIAPNAMWPVSQVECFYFLADILNIGDSTAANTILDVAIENQQNSTIVYTDTFFIGGFPSNSNLENIPLQNCFTPDGTITEYEGTYSISSDCIDPSPANNIQAFQFETTGYVFSKETGATQLIAPAAGNWDPGEPHSWAYGNFYYVVDGNSAFADAAIFSIGNADAPNIAGKLLSINLYKWEDTNNDESMDPDEREVVAFNFYEVIGTELPTDLITIPLNEFPTNAPGPVALESATGYVLMLEYLTTSDQETIFFTASDEYDYSAQVFTSKEKGAPRFAQMLAINGVLTNEPYGSIGFGLDIAPVARLVLGETIIDDVAELSSQSKNLYISPNPVSDILNIRLPEIKNPEKGQLLIYNQTGQLMSEKFINIPNKQQIDLDVSHFTNGVYFIRFITGVTAISTSFIVLH